MPSRTGYPATRMPATHGATSSPAAPPMPRDEQRFGDALPDEPRAARAECRGGRPFPARAPDERTTSRLATLMQAISSARPVSAKSTRSAAPISQSACASRRRSSGADEQSPRASADKLGGSREVREVGAFEARAGRHASEDLEPVRVRDSVNKSRPSSRCMASGSQRSVGRPTSVPLKLCAATPTSVNG